MQRRQVGVHVLDQARVDRDGDVVVEQRGLERAAELAHVLLEDVALHMRVERRRERAGELAVAAPECGEDGVAVGLHRRCAVPVVGGRIEAHFLARRQRDLRIRQVGIGEHRVNGARGLRQQAGAGHDPLLCLRERVRCSPQDVVEEHPVLGEARLLRQEPLDGRTAHCQQFGTHEGRGGLQLAVHLGRLLLHLPRACHPGVLVAQRGGVDVHALELAVRLLPVAHGGQQRCRRFAEPALPPGQLWNLLAQ